MLTPKFRLSFPALFQPKLNDLNGKHEFSCVALFPVDADLGHMKAAVKDLLTEKFTADQAKWPTPLKSPFRDQGEKVKKDANGAIIIGTDGKPVLQEGHVAGAIFMNLKSTNRPGIVDQDVKAIIDPSKLYAGCWVIADVNPYYYDQKGNRGVAFGLNHIQLVADGEPLSGRPSVESVFKSVPKAAPAAAEGKPATSLF